MQTSLKVTGMHCEGCEGKVQRMLPKIESVANVTADRNAGRVEFDFDGNDKTLQAVREKIEDLGYSVAE